MCSGDRPRASHTFFRRLWLEGHRPREHATMLAEEASTSFTLSTHAHVYIACGDGPSPRSGESPRCFRERLSVCMCLNRERSTLSADLCLLAAYVLDHDGFEGEQ